MGPLAPLGIALAAIQATLPALLPARGREVDPFADAPLVVYASFEPEICRPVIDRFRAAHPELAVELVEIDPRVALERIRGEKASGRVVASVWWGGDDLSLHEAAAEGLLARSEPAWGRGLREPERDEGYLWCGQFLNPIAVVHRRGMADVPASYVDLADPRYKGRLLLATPAVSLPMQRFLGICLTVTFPTRGGDDRALDWVALLNANQAPEVPGDLHAAFERIAAPEGSGALTVAPAADAARARDQEGLAIDFVVLPGAPAFLEGIACLADAPSSAAAAQFIDFVGADSEIRNPVKRGRIPLAPGAAALPDWMPPARSRAVLGDREAMLESLPAWLPKVERRMRAGAAAVPEGDDPYAWVLNVVDVVGTIAIVGVLFVLVRRGRWQGTRAAAPVAEAATAEP